MANTTLLSLPTELLDKIYFYLDWNQSTSLEPLRPEIRSLSLTCRHLRETLLPLLFRNVTLRLRWVDGALVEPALFRIRRDHPHLANYVRSVYIETQFGQLRGSYWNFKDFSVPGQLSSWLEPSYASGTHQNAIESSHHERLQSIARTVLKKYNYPAVPENSAQVQDDLTFARTIQQQLLVSSGNNPEDTSQIGVESEWEAGRRTIDQFRVPMTTKEQRIAQRDARVELDALMVVLLCLPSCVNSLAFETVHSHRSDTLQNTFALHVAAAALRVFGHRLQGLTMITSPERMPPRRTLNDPRHPGLYPENSIITEDVLSSVTHVGTLRLSDHHGNGNPRYREIDSDWQIRWHVLANILTRLELWNMQSHAVDLLSLVTGFTNLESLTLKNIVLGAPPNPQHHPHRQADQLFWLAFFIELRRQMPTLKFQFGDLKSWGEHLRMVTLPESALHWLAHEAVPEGSTLGFDRETRLTEDFESFLPLWYAEDGEAGKLAKEKGHGKLVDDAMASRWKTFENQR